MALAMTEAHGAAQREKELAALKERLAAAAAARSDYFRASRDSREEATHAHPYHRALALAESIAS